MIALPKKRYTIDEYLELDKNSEEKYEYFDGAIRGVRDVFAMSGGSINHGQIVSNLNLALRQRLSGRDCRAFTSDVRIKVPAAFPYRYPEASVVCGEPVTEMTQGQEMLVNPILIVEVLSPTTAAYDLGRRFSEYQSIDSFEEYLLISQDRPHVIQHTRQSPGRWLRIEIDGMDSEVTLESLNIALPMREIYERVEFETEEPPILKPEQMNV